MKYIMCVLVLVMLVSTVYAETAEDSIIIGKLGIYQPISLVVDSDPSNERYFYDLTNLQNVGRIEGTSWGNVTDKGRIILVGHTPGVFEKINQLEVSDQIILYMNGKRHEFFVFDMYTVHKSNDSVISTPAYQFEVVLITCVEGYPDKRLIIKAK